MRYFPEQRPPLMYGAGASDRGAARSRLRRSPRDMLMCATALEREHLDGFGDAAAPATKNALLRAQVYADAPKSTRSS